MGGCVSKSSKEKDADKAPYGTKDKPEAAAETKAEEAAPVDASPAEAKPADDSQAKEAEPAKAEEKTKDKEEEKPKDEAAPAEGKTVDKPVSQGNIDLKFSPDGASYSRTSYVKTTQIRTVGGETTKSSVETTTTGGEADAPDPQEIIEKFKREAMSGGNADGLTQVSSSSSKRVVTTTTVIKSGDEAPQVESVRTTSVTKSEIDAEGKEHKESSSKTEVKTDGEFPVAFPERPSLSGLQSDKSEPVPAIEIESPSPVKPEPSSPNDASSGGGDAAEKKEPVVNGAAKEESPSKINGHVSPEKPKQPIEASVVITAVNGSSKAEEIKKDTAALQASSESGAEDDKEISASDLEPVTRANLRNSIKSLLIDLEPVNKAIQSRHSLTLNTRAKFLHSFDKWFLNTDKEKQTSRLMAIVGKPGIGKTCIAAEISRRHEQHLAGSHFFQNVNASLDLNDPRCMIMGLARVFCDVFPNFAYMLPKLDKLEDLVLNADVGELFEELLQMPLNSAGLDHDTEKSMLIMIDALDECGLSDREQFLQVLNNSSESLPDWLYILVTVRNENQILGQLENAQVLELRNNSDNVADIKRYLKEPMGKYMDRISLDGGLTQLAKKAEGSFLTAYLLKQKLDALSPDTKIALRSIDSMFVSGFSALCKEFFQGYRDQLTDKSNPKDALTIYNTVLGILVAAKEPLNKEFTQFCPFEDKEALVGLQGVLAEEDGCMSLCHPHLIDWLCNETLSGDLSASRALGREKLAELCTTWLSSLIEDSKAGTSHPKLTEYALKHVVWHLTDVPKQHENLTKFLCSIKYIQEKLRLAGVHLSHLVGDYRHAHIQTNGDSSKLITMSDYMKRQPKLMEQIESFYKFVSQRGTELNQSPEFTLHIAANYPTVRRIQENARLELSRQPWIEDLTAVPESHGVSSHYSGQIIAFDLSHDAKTLGLVTKDAEYNLNLHLLNSHTGEKKSEAVDIKGVKDRIGLTMKFLPDGNIFVGSLTTFVSFRGKPLPSGLDMQSIQMKEKFSIECCAVSTKYLVCGLNTFPWNGRSLHLTAFDLKAKKCSKTIEVLRFRFGGSAQFGVKCCAVSRDEAMVAACVKQSNKPQLKVNVWGLPKWTVLHSVDIDCDSITKCSFVDSSTLFFGSSIRSMAGTAGYAFTPIRNQLWDFNLGGKPVEIDPNEAHSVFVANPKRTASAKWSSTSGPALVSIWSKSKVKDTSDVSYTIRGLKAGSDMRISGDYLMFVENDELRIYNVNDLESSDSKATAGERASTLGITVTNIGLFSRSDDVIMTHSTPSDRNQECVSVSVLDPRQEDLTLTPTPFQNETRRAYKSSDSIGQFKCFRGNGSTLEVCCSSADGNFLVFNAGNKIKAWNRSLDQIFSLPAYEDQPEKNDEYKQYKGINCAVSGKESTVGIVYGQLPYNIYLYDLKSQKMTQKLCVKDEGKPSIVSDISFLPSNGFVLSYHREYKHGLAVWNQRNGSEVSRVHSACICYAKASPASDRFVLSLKKNNQEGEVTLRNSDNKMNSSLATGGIWLPHSESSDLEFSVDGTVLVGVSRETDICRVWNAGNGEVLKDLSTAFTSKRVEIVGMLTNTHVVFQDERLVVYDVGSGDCIAVLPLEDELMRRLSRAGLRITSRGNYMVGAKANGHLCVFECHNFQPVKRKTTLQRMKSFTK